MKFNVNQQDLQEALNYCQGVIEKRSTLPILSNILLEAKSSQLTITATDLDLIFIHKINNIEVLEEGKTTTTSSIMYDIVRKFSSGKKINLVLNEKSKLHLESEKSIFNLNCISASEFPLTNENSTHSRFEKIYFSGIVKGYKSSIHKFPEGKDSIGMPIHVYQESINAMFVEYLVNFEYFVQVMENYGFALVDKKEANHIGFTDSNGLFDMLYRKMEKENFHEINKKEYANAPLMSHYEQTISFLNRYFIFKKMRDLSDSTLQNLEKDIEEAEENISDELLPIEDPIEKRKQKTQGKSEKKESEKKDSDEKTKEKTETDDKKPPVKRRKKVSNKRVKIDKDAYSPIEK